MKRKKKPVRVVSVRRPGQPGTIKLQDEYGSRLLAVRYIYDRNQMKRTKTVELIVEEKPWLPDNPRPKPDDQVPIFIPFHNSELRNRAKSLGARWNPKIKLWFIRFRHLPHLGVPVKDLLCKEESAEYTIN